MKSAIVYKEHGNPLEVTALESLQEVTVERGQVRVGLRYAPINPADLNVIEGKYPVRPSLPATPGVEGVGIVEEVGSDVTHLREGDMVLMPHYVGTWREEAVIPVDNLEIVPAGIPLEQAAMLKINPATAWRMLHDFKTLQPGDWVIQNAANSGVGRAVIQIAKSLGLKTVNLVRREELLPELKEEGGDVVLCEGTLLSGQIKEMTEGASIRLALNAVGGESALTLANALADEGTVVTYGAMARQPLRIPNGLLIFKNLCWQGFWITKWYQNAAPEDKREMFNILYTLAKSGTLRAEIDAIYFLHEFREAIGAAQQGRRSGKILFRMNE